MTIYPKIRIFHLCKYVIFDKVRDEVIRDKKKMILFTEPESMYP
jgi:hypothetical protein